MNINGTRILYKSLFKFEKELLATGLFETRGIEILGHAEQDLDLRWSQNYFGIYVLLSTDYQIRSWRGMVNQYYRWENPTKVQKSRYPTFEQVFNSVDKKTQKQLAFHLDLLR